jgi:hypothetical protein
MHKINQRRLWVTALAVGLSLVGLGGARLMGWEPGLVVSVLAGTFVGMVVGRAAGPWVRARDEGATP